MRNLILFSFFLLFFASCRDEIAGKSKPDGLVPKDTMVMLLKDLTLLESHVQVKYQQVSVFKETMRASGNEILKRYQMNESRFERSIDYYMSRQTEMQEIYSQVLDSLNRLAGKIVLKDSAESTQLKPTLPGFVKMDTHLKN